MTGIIPELAQLNLTEIPLVHGFYSLGLVKKYCPNVEIVCLRMNRNDQWTDLDLDPERLYNVIRQHVTTGKTVFVGTKIPKYTFKKHPATVPERKIAFLIIIKR